ncbi:MAG: glycosyltransferase family 2 protein [Rivularia sp. ALOHA_DT_140]|nr:glycosyltransferase family 2 protein [Rivularia sp. ALOHA_DT_140]
MFEVGCAIFIKQPSLKQLKEDRGDFSVKHDVYRKYREPGKVSVIIAAYLPNEKDIIVETLQHFLHHLKYPSEYEIILAYNTPQTLEVETQLQVMTQYYSHLRILKVEGSTSKAENLNAAINLASGEMIALFDADHRPTLEDTFERAWHWIANGYDVVQGRCTIRNYKDSIISSLVAIEFEVIYGLCHEARSILTNTAIFGGSNAYWKAETLKLIQFNKAQLTEDIDATLRLLTRGHKLVHDRTIIATEEALTTFMAWWRQRKRWNQGWLECTLKYQKKMNKCRYLKKNQKLYWFYTLIYREVFSLISLQLLGLLVLQFLIGQEYALSDSIQLLLDFTFFYTILTSWITTVGAIAIKSQPYGIKVFLAHFFASIPYTLCKMVITLVAWYDHTARETSWVVTPRQKSKYEEKVTHSYDVANPRYAQK